MPYPVKGLLEVYEDMVEILLMLQVFLSTLPAALRVLTFHVETVMSSLPRSLSPVAHLSFPPWCPTGNAVVVPGRDRSGMDILSFFAVIGGVSWAYL